MDKSTQVSLETVAAVSRPDALLTRRVDDRAWYGVLDRIGLKYTGLFRGLHSILAATGSNGASATVAALEVPDGGRYSLHPAVMDRCFHVFTVAAARGLGKNINQLVVPTFIGEVVVSPGELDLDVKASLQDTIRRGSYIGDMSAHSAGRQVLHLKDFRTSALTSADEAAEEQPLISQLQWTPHSDFVDLSKYMHPLEPQPQEWHLLEELVLHCALDHLERLKLIDETPAHLAKFMDWMRVVVSRYQAGANVFVPNSTHLEALSSEQRQARIEAVAGAVSVTRYAAFSNAIRRVFTAAPDIFAGQTHPLHVLLEDDTLAEFYNTMEALDYAGTVQLLGNTTPRMRILEVGAGTGGTTAKMLAALRSSYGERLYGSYTYTDVSSGFMAAAKQRFAEAEAIEYAVLDVSKDPVEQGFRPGSFDLIVGANVLHATPSLSATLKHLHTLLSPGGRIFLEELCPKVMFVNYVMGFLPGWWLGADDDRAEEPYVSPERWTKELVAAGFQKPEAIVLDYRTPYQISGGIVATREARATKMARVTLLCHVADGPYVPQMRQSLEMLNIAVDICLFGQALPAAQDVISLVDLQEPMVHGMSEETFGALIRHFKSLNDAHMLWVTQASQVDCEDPRASMVLGLARTARNDLSIKLFTVELDGATPRAEAAEAVARILMRALKSPEVDADHTNPDYEFAVAKGEIIIPRVHWQTFSESFARRDDEDDPIGTSQDQAATVRKRIDVTTPGLLHTMHWSEEKIRAPAEGEVLVQAKTAGLNFRDLMIALGVLDNNTDEMGFEGSGVVRAVGPGVQRLSVGDRVMYMGSGCFSTCLTMRETLCIKIADTMSFEQAAALPGVYTTALMALVDKANLQPGQSVLIHSACGGVGLAAIQIAQSVGADVSPSSHVPGLLNLLGCRESDRRQRLMQHFLDILHRLKRSQDPIPR